MLHRPIYELLCFLLNEIFPDLVGNSGGIGPATHRVVGPGFKSGLCQLLFIRNVNNVQFIRLLLYSVN